MASHWLDCLDPGPATRILTKAPGSIGRVYTLGSAGDTQDTPGATHQPVPLVPPLPGWGLLKSLFLSQAPQTVVLEILSHLSDVVLRGNSEPFITQRSLNLKPTPIQVLNVKNNAKKDHNNIQTFFLLEGW